MPNHSEDVKVLPKPIKKTISFVISEHSKKGLTEAEFTTLKKGSKAAGLINYAQFNVYYFVNVSEDKKTTANLFVSTKDLEDGGKNLCFVGQVDPADLKTYLLNYATTNAKCTLIVDMFTYTEIKETAKFSTVKCSVNEWPAIDKNIPTTLNSGDSFFCLTNQLTGQPFYQLGNGLIRVFQLEERKTAIATKRKGKTSDSNVVNTDF